MCLLNICLNYGSHEEILRATKNIALDYKNNKLDINKLDSNLFETPVKLNDDFYSNTNLQLLNLYNGDNSEYIKKLYDKIHDQRQLNIENDPVLRDLFNQVRKSRILTFGQ